MSLWHSHIRAYVATVVLSAAIVFVKVRALAWKKVCALFFIISSQQGCPNLLWAWYQRTTPSRHGKRTCCKCWGSSCTAYEAKLYNNRFIAMYVCRCCICNCKYLHIHNLLCFLLSFNSPSSTSDHAMCSLPAHLQVVVKFLRKASILPDGWVEDEEMGVVPREIALLAGITHPHIVEVRTPCLEGTQCVYVVTLYLLLCCDWYVHIYVCITLTWSISFSLWYSFPLSPLTFCPFSPCLPLPLLPSLVLPSPLPLSLLPTPPIPSPPLPLLFPQLLEAYENHYYFQMVMSKHGDGMDLFSFIDSCQLLTEPLTSYMFRQVVSALDYLHQRSILHRDIKVSNTRLALQHIVWMEAPWHCSGGVLSLQTPNTLCIVCAQFVLWTH